MNCAIVTQFDWMLIQRILPFPRAMLPLWWMPGVLSAVGIARFEELSLRRRYPRHWRFVDFAALTVTVAVAGLVLHGRQSLGINGAWPDDLQRIAQSLAAAQTESRVFTNYADAGLYYYLSRFQATARVNRFNGPGEYVFMCRKFEGGLDNVTRTATGLRPVIDVWQDNGGPPVDAAQFQPFGETRYYQLYRVHLR